MSGLFVFLQELCILYSNKNASRSYRKRIKQFLSQFSKTAGTKHGRNGNMFNFQRLYCLIGGRQGVAFIGFICLIGYQHAVVACILF